MMMVYGVLGYIERWSHSNQLPWIGQSQDEISLELSQFEVDVIVYWYTTATTDEKW